MGKDAAAAADEGARSATRFIEAVADGQCAADLSHALHKLGLQLKQQAGAGAAKCSGELALKLKFNVEASGIVGVAYEINAKEPKSRTQGSVFWLTKGGNLSQENPRQTSLPGIREVKRSDDVRDIEPANDNATEERSV